MPPEPRSPHVCRRPFAWASLLTLTGVLPEISVSPNSGVNRDYRDLLWSKVIYIWSRRVLPDFGVAPTRLLTGLIRLSRTALLFQWIHQNAPLLHTSGLSPVSCYMVQFTSVDMIIHFLHMEPFNPPTYYTDVYIYLSRLHQ